MAHPDYVLIMAGGIGSRFWPLSNSHYPKQFLDIIGCGQTLIQQTFRRFLKIVPAHKIFIVTASNYIHKVAEQLPLLPKENVLAEPLRKNTAPGIAYLCFKLLKTDPGASMIVSPADHQILDEDEFVRICERATGFIEDNEALVTLGIHPTHASSSYGYIQRKQLPVESQVYPVKQYIEKPYPELAKSFVKSGDFLWNSGVFIWKIRDILHAYRLYLPDMFWLFEGILTKLNTADEYEAINRVYTHCEDISIDHGILERSDRVFIIPASFEWTNLANWNSAWEQMPKDYQYNAVNSNQVKLVDASRCIVHTTPGKMVIIQGLEDYVVVDTADGLLIYSKDKEQSIKMYVAEMAAAAGKDG